MNKKHEDPRVDEEDKDPEIKDLDNIENQEKELEPEKSPEPEKEIEKKNPEEDEDVEKPRHWNRMSAREKRIYNRHHKDR